MIGIGLEEFGLEDFVAGKYWDGELYLDTNKKSYADLGFRKYNLVTVMASMVQKTARDAISEVKKEKIDGNMKGDGLQTGGTIVVAKGGNLLMGHRQDNPADHAKLEDILKALGIDPKELDSEALKGAEAASKVTCNDDVCTKP